MDNNNIHQNKKREREREKRTSHIYSKNQDGERAYNSYDYHRSKTTTFDNPMLEWMEKSDKITPNQNVR